MRVLFAIPRCLFKYLGIVFAIPRFGSCRFVADVVLVDPEPWFPQLWQIVRLVMQ